MDRFLKVGFSVFALLAILFGFVRIGQGIKLTFNDSGNKQTSDQTQENVALDEAKLRVKDTDGDGLLDWDELNVHGTSPYLADTDSDGISDKSEVDNGTDPNCPAGRDCGSTPSGQDTALPTSPLETLMSGVDLPQGTDASPQDFFSTLEAQDPPTPDEIRSLLIQGGVSPEQLDGVSDEDLVALFDEILAQQQQAASTQ